LGLVFDENDLAPITGGLLAVSEMFLMQAVEAAALVAIGRSWLVTGARPQHVVTMRDIVK
jgi:hypothetical protein